MKNIIKKLAGRFGLTEAQAPIHDGTPDGMREAAYELLRQAGYNALRAPLPGKRQLAVVLPADLAALDPAENDALWSAISTQLERLTVTVRSTMRLPFVSGAGADGKGKSRQ